MSAKVVSIHVLSRAVRDGAQVRPVARAEPAPVAPDVDYARIIAGIQLPRVPTPEEIAALVRVEEPINIRKVNDKIEIKTRDGRTFTFKIAGTSTVVQQIDYNVTGATINSDNTITFTRSDGSTFTTVGSINVPFDDYSSEEYLEDQTSAGSVLTFNFVDGPVQKVWVMMHAANADDDSIGRARTDGNDPTSTLGTLLTAGAYQPIATATTSVVKVLAPSGKVISVYGLRR